MNEDFDLAKTSLQNVNNLKDIKENPVIDSILLAPLKTIPLFGDLINTSTNRLLNEFQERKQKELIASILNDKNIITSEMVSDIEFIINFNKVIETVRRLATNDKVKYFGNLIKNGYLSGEHIKNDLFEEYLNILNTMSYREIQCLVDYKLFCEEKNKIKGKSNSVKYDRWNDFQKEFTKKNNITSGELDSLFMRIRQTGFINEELYTEDGDVDDNAVNALKVEGAGYSINDSFLKFYDVVLNLSDF